MYVHELILSTFAQQLSRGADRTTIEEAIMHYRLITVQFPENVFLFIDIKKKVNDILLISTREDDV